MAAVRSVTVLGSTGSVGRNTVDLIRSDPARFSVRALTCNANAGLLAEQAVAVNAELAVAADPSAYAELKERLAGTGIRAAAGGEALLEAAAFPADWTMAAIVGMAGLPPLMRAVERGGIVAIANKEPLVAAWPFVLEAARRAGTTILPVDSEHNAIFQVFDSQRTEGIEKIVLTASGGPFLRWPQEKMDRATPEQAIAHPNWSMGAKISVDSATMANKALEIIEAHRLFGLPPERIEVLVHPQSIVHGMVVYRDGSVLAQMGAPDMRTPIAHALAWPERMTTTGRTLDLSRAFSLGFEAVDAARFPAISIAYECLREGLRSCIAFNAANEVAVQAYLQKKIAFWQIVNTVRDIVNRGWGNPVETIENVMAFDENVRGATLSYIMNPSGKQRAV